MLQNRPPIVVILGHVDHGKTSLLDYLRKSNVVASEAGGITQHIRSFQLKSGEKTITFIDTPGHAAFSGMRQRGSTLSDIAVLVVSSVDGVMPQTVESINFIRESKTPFVVALTKSDLPDANPDRVKTQLAEQQVFVEDMGGDVPVVSVSVKNGKGIADLLEILGLLAELHPPTWDMSENLSAIVLESRLDSKKGPLATVVIKTGVLKIGQNLFQDKEIGKARAILDFEGNNQKEAFPSQPVEIMGLNSVPGVGSIISDQIIKIEKAESSKKIDANAEIKLILKTDVVGSSEAVIWSLPKEVTILSSGTGDVVENDVLLASANGATVIAFNVRCPAGVAKLAEVEKVPIKHFEIIYQLLDYLREIIDNKDVEIVTGKAQIMAEFDYNSDHVAGGKVTEGRINKTDALKLLRGENEIGRMKFKSFKTGKTDLVAAKLGTEFGAIFSPSLDFQVGDTIIAVTLGHGKT